MAEITFVFPCVLRGWVTFPCGQVFSSAWGPLWETMASTSYFFFRSDQSRQRDREARAMCVSLFIQG